MPLPFTPAEQCFSTPVQHPTMKTSLSIDQKCELLVKKDRRVKDGELSNQDKLAQWIQIYLSFLTTPDQSTVRRVLCNQNILAIAKITCCYRARAPESNFSDAALVAKVRNVCTKRVAVS